MGIGHSALTSTEESYDLYYQIAKCYTSQIIDDYELSYSAPDRAHGAYSVCIHAIVVFDSHRVGTVMDSWTRLLYPPEPSFIKITST